jgi:putative component of membrane protein insertase Oxa1/YidC/SpoIIIJ protein YidD
MEQSQTWIPCCSNYSIQAITISMSSYSSSHQTPLAYRCNTGPGGGAAVTGADPCGYSLSKPTHTQGCSVSFSGFALFVLTYENPLCHLKGSFWLISYLLTPGMRRSHPAWAQRRENTGRTRGKPSRSVNSCLRGTYWLGFILQQRPGCRLVD